MTTSTPTGIDIARMHGISVAWKVVNSRTPLPHERDFAHGVLCGLLSRADARPHLRALSAASSAQDSAALLEACSKLFGFLDPKLPQNWEAVLVPF